MNSMTRRNFLATTAGAALLPWSRVQGANSDLRVAVIGVNNIGKTHLMGFPKIPGVRVVGVCDVDENVLGARAEEFEKANGSIKKYGDLRRVFDDPGVDAVVLAVPNHWHALGTIWACQAGKDVYVEKPCSYNIWEADQMIKAADRYQRIVQVGIQRRSLDYMQSWFAELRAGALGRIHSVRALYFARRQGIGHPTGNPSPPASINHDLWSGPASTALLRAKYHYDWHWFWETGNGELGNNGPHVLDLARTVLGVQELPRQIWSLGGRFGWNEDNGQTPNTHTVHYGYEPAPIIMEIRNLPQSAASNSNIQERGISYGLIVECEEGSYVGWDQGTVFDKEGRKVREIRGEPGPDGGRQRHRENFVKAVLSRKTSDLNCSLPDGHLSSSLCHLGNISHRLGSLTTVVSATEALTGNDLFQQAGQRLAEHLAANDIPPEKTMIHLGAPLEFDPQTQSFPKSPEANSLLRRVDRAPFIVPETP